VNRPLLAVSALCVALAAAARWLPGDREPARRKGPAVVAPAAARPLAFERNDGQADERVRFTARGAGGAVFVTDDGMTIAPSGEGRAPLRLAFDGASAARVDGEGALPGYVNYLKGRDPSRWRTRVPLFARAVCRGVWPGIDVAFHGDARRVEYDFELAAGADTDDIALRFDGADSVAVDTSGDLVVRAGTEEFRHLRPRVVQDGREIAGAFAPRGGGRVGFRVDGRDPARALVIDPVIAYATYLGGAASEEPTDVAVDAQGDLYVTGSVSSVDFPIANPLPGAPSAGGTDAFVTKLNASGAKFLYSTYFGGSGTDVGWGIRTDASGIYLAGSTTSSDLPAINSWQPDYAGGQVEGDAFLVKLNPAGDAVVYSTLLGGSGDDGCRGFAIDASGNAYLGGFTNSPDFPTTAGAAQRTLSGPSDAWAAKISGNGSVLSWSTYFGGSSAPDEIDGVAVDPSGDLFVAGFSASFDLPASAGYQKALGGGAFDGFVAKLDTKGALLACTYLGGAERDACRRVAVDGAGRPYVCGYTLSEDFPRASALQGALAGGTGTGDAFVTVFDANLASVLVSTYLGGDGDDDARALALAPDGSVFVAGDTSSATFPSQSGLQTTNGGSRDGFVTKLSAGGLTLAWSTYLGGSGYDGASAIAVDSYGDAYVAMTAGSSALPTLCAAQPQFGGGQYDCYVAKLTDVASAKPATPLSPVATAESAYRVALTWVDASRNECSFRVERRAESGDWTAVATPDTNVTSFADDGVLPDRTYSYRVVAVNPLGESDASAEASVTTPQTLTISQRVGSLTESNAKRQDRIQFTALLRFTVASADHTMQPVADGAQVLVGADGDPVVVTIPPGDRRWRRTGKQRYAWTSPPKTRPQVRVEIDLTVPSLKVSLSALDFPTTPNGSVFVALRSGDDAGHVLRAWTPRKKKPGRFKLP
jgi:hypothetical protein